MTKENGPAEIHERPYQAIDELRKDATRVEIWATALSTFAQPVPDYQPSDKLGLRRAPKSGRQ